MLGLTRLHRRYRRFRYNNMARFPRLFVILDMAKLPLQILLIALPLWIAVGFYDDNFSYQANNERLKKSRAAAIAELPPAPLVDDNLSDDQLADGKQVTIDRLPDTAQSGKDSGAMAVKSLPVEEAIYPQDSDLDTADLVDSPLDKVARIDSDIERIAGPSDIFAVDASIDTVLPSTALSQEPLLRDASWLAAQPDASFVVQFESSGNVDLMRRQVRKFQTSEALALYPYKVSQEGDLVYGLSYGLYDSLSEARAASVAMPAEMSRYGVWIRQVGLLKKQMQSVEGTIAR